MKVYIADLWCSIATESKLHTKHDITMADVREALQLAVLERAIWDDDPERGRRLLVTGSTSTGRRLNAVLHPADGHDGCWWVATAMWA